MKKLIVKSPKEMNRFAAQFAKTLKGGEVLALTGELGAGKTAFVKGLAKALGIKQVVQSPTFLLMKCYPVRIVHGRLSQPKADPPRADMVHALCHVDAYRIKRENELLTIGLVEHLQDGGTVTVIEWADLVPGLIPSRAVKIFFAHGRNDKERIITVTNNS